MKNAHHPIFRLFVAYYNSTVCYNTWCLRTLSICINSFPIVRLQKRGRKKYIFDQHTNLRCSFVLFITWKTCDNSIITPTPCSVSWICWSCCSKHVFKCGFRYTRNTSYVSNAFMQSTYDIFSTNCIFIQILRHFRLKPFTKLHSK